MIRIPFSPRACVAALLSCLLGACATHQAFENRRHSSSSDATSVQALLGAALYDDDLEFERSDPNDPTNTAVADLSQMPVLGIGGQYRMAGDRSLEAGLDGTLLFSWWKDDAQVIGTGNGSAVILISTRLFLTDIGFGAFVATVLGDWLRLSAGVGPMVVFGSGTFEDETQSSSESAFGVGGYVRGTAEIRLDRGSFIGFGVRGVSYDLDFGSGIEDVDADGLQVLLTYTQQF